MAEIKKIYDDAERTTQVYPQTHERAVVDNNGTTAETKFQMITDLVNQKQMEIGAVPSDIAPTEDSTNWVTSGGVYNAVQPQNINYDNSQSGLAADNVQGALDEVADGVTETKDTKFNPVYETQASHNLQNIKITVANKGFTANVIAKKGSTGSYFAAITLSCMQEGKTYNVEFDYTSDWDGFFRIRNDAGDLGVLPPRTYSSGSGHISITGIAAVDSTEFTFWLPQNTAVGSTMTISNFIVNELTDLKDTVNNNSNNIEKLLFEKADKADIGEWKAIDLASFPLDNGLIIFAGNTLKLNTRDIYKYIAIPVNAGDCYICKAPSDHTVSFCYAASREVVNDFIDPVVGYNFINSIPSGEEVNIIVPEGAQYIFMQASVSGTSKLPEYIKEFHNYVDDLVDEVLVDHVTTTLTSHIRSSDVEYYTKEFNFVYGKKYTIKASIPVASEAAIMLIAYDSRSVTGADHRVTILTIPAGSTEKTITSDTLSGEFKYLGIYSSVAKSYYCTINITEESDGTIPSVVSTHSDKSEVYAVISDFIEEGKTHSECIDNCLAFVHPFYKKTIVFDMDLMIDKAILLDSNTTLLLQNCIVKQNNYVYDNIFRGANIVLPEPDSDDNMFYVPETIEYIENVNIIGDGNSKLVGPDINRIYDGNRVPSYQGQEMVGDQYGARALSICFTCVKGGSIQGVDFEQTRMYAIQLEYCEDFLVKDIEVTSSCKNGDGIDVRTGCRNVVIKNFNGKTSDDLIAINSHFSDKDENTYYVCPMKYSWRWEKNISDDLKEINGVYIDGAINRTQSTHRAVGAWAINPIHNISINNVTIEGDITSDNVGHIDIAGINTLRISNIIFNKTSDSYPAISARNVTNSMIVNVKRKNSSLTAIGEYSSSVLINVDGIMD